MTALPRLAAIAAALCLSAGALPAQETAPPHQQLAKTIGQAQPQVVPSLFVLNARNATLDGGTLTLAGVAGTSIVFADRPVRAAGHVPTGDLIAEWAKGSDSFAADPPNATLSVFDATGDAIADAVVTLTAPKLDGDTLTFEVTVLEGGLYGHSGPAALFIDNFGLSQTQLAYATIPRRAAMYSGTGYNLGTERSRSQLTPLPPCGTPPYPACN